MDAVRSLEELAGLLARRPEHRVYLRYSAGPDADRNQVSRDYESGLALPGLAVLDLDPPPWWARPVTDWLARQICKYDHLAEKDEEQYAWLLTGREVGRGPDSEPLLADAAPLARIAPELQREARERYHERFEVGRAR